MKTCEKCGVELLPMSWRERDGLHDHGIQRCRDRLAARLAEAERLLNSNQQLRRELSDQASALRTELETTKARLAEALSFLGEVARIPNAGVDWQDGAAWVVKKLSGVKT